MLDPDAARLNRLTLVLRQGAVAGELPRAEFSQANLLRLMAGVEAQISTAN